MVKKSILFLVFAFNGWALCGAVIMIARAFTSIHSALIIHALATPLIFGLLSFVFYKNFNDTSPALTALAFLAFVIFMDAALVAPVLEKSYDMFLSPLGTWIPFLSIFVSSYMTGALMDRTKDESVSESSF